MAQYHKLSKLQEALNRAFNIKQKALTRQNEAWDRLLSTKSQSTIINNQPSVEIRSANNAYKRAKRDYQKACYKYNKMKRTYESMLASNNNDFLYSRSNKKVLAKRAGVPCQYINNVWIDIDSNGMINIYFGGKDKPYGLGHGHYVMSPKGKITYQRDPLVPHGAHNYKQPQKANNDSLPCRQSKNRSNIRPVNKICHKKPMVM